MNNQEICGTCWYYCPTGQSCKHGVCSWQPIEESVPDWLNIEEQDNERAYCSPACACWDKNDVGIYEDEY